MLKVCLGPFPLSAVDNAERARDSDSKQALSAQPHKVSNGRADLHLQSDHI